MDNTQKLELKIIALKEGFKKKVASTLDEYEDQIADLRIEITEQGQALQMFRDENESLKRQVAELQSLREDQNVQEEATPDSDDSN